MGDLVQKPEGRKAGYYLMARRIDESPVSKMPPHVREIWHLLIRKAMWRDGTDLKRGQLLITYKQIQDDLSWVVGYRRHTYQKHHIDTALNLLAAPTLKPTAAPPMIRKARTTRGIVVTVLNYDTYQNFKTYETDSETDLEPTAKLCENRHDREGREYNKELIEEEDARIAFDILKSESRLSSLNTEQFNAILSGMDPRPADLPAAARSVAREARMNGKEIQHPAVFIEARLRAVAEKKDVGENPKKNRAPALVLLRPAGAVDQRDRLRQKAEQLLAEEKAG